MSDGNLTWWGRGQSALLRAAHPTEVTLREAILAMVGLLIAPWLLFAAHGIRGGIYADAWAEIAQQRFTLRGDLGARLATCVDGEALKDLPLACMLRHGQFAALHGNGVANSVLGLILFGLVLGAFYVVLRAAHLPVLFSGIAVGLLLVFQGADSLRLWPMISVSVGLLLFMAGLLVGVSAARSPRAVTASLLAIAGIVLLLAPSTVYQTITPLTAIAIPYIWWASRRWRRSLTIGGAATIGAVIIGYYRASASGRVVERDGQAALEQVMNVLRGAVDTWSDAFIGFPMPAGWVALTVLVAGLVATILALGQRIGTHAMRTAWALLGSGVVVAALGVAAFFPADGYYVPRPMGIDNRMNVVAQFGYVLVALAFLIFIAVVVANLFEQRMAGLAAGAALVLIAVSTSAASSLKSARYWADSWTSQQQVLAAVNNLVPRSQSDVTIFTFGHNLYEPNWLPVFAQPWELDSALKVTRGQPGVGGYPISGWSCVKTGLTRDVGVQGIKTPAAVQYGRAIFVNVARHAVKTPATMDACRRVLAAWGTNPTQ